MTRQQLHRSTRQAVYICTYNATLRRLRANIAAVEKQHYIFSVCVCSIRYPACHVHAPYCHPWPVRLYNIFPHYLMKGTIFGKAVIEHKMCVCWFSLQNLSETVLILRRNERDVMKNVYWSSCTWSTRHSCPIVTKIEFSLQIFEKLRNIIFQENPSSGRGVVPRGWTDGQTDMTKLTVAFLSFWNASKITHYVHTVFVCFVFISGQTATDVLYNKLVFTAEMKIVYCAVRTGSLNPTIYASFLKG